MSSAISAQGKALCGKIRVPGDKSVSHRALMFASQAIGTSMINGLLLGEDVLHTADSLRMMGVTITNTPEGSWLVDGVGVGGLREPEDVVYMGNAGTGVRLMMGLVATHPFTTFFTGDASLRKRPMNRVITPLETFGARFLSRSNKGLLPLALTGTANPLPVTYRLPVPSAQVKSAILLAGLNTAGKTTVIESEATRNHTELMLRHFGADITVEETEKGASAITITGHPNLKAQTIEVPGDPSSAAFPAVAALITEGSDLIIENICINPSRIGLYITLQEMGGDIRFINERQVAGETIADLHIRYSQLTGVTVPAARAPSMIDEYPVLAIAASVAKGSTVMEGLAELKVKESNRLQAIADGLAACGIRLSQGEDSLIVEGSGGKTVSGGATITTHLDHRIAMAFLVLGTVSENPIAIDDSSMIATSFPGFIPLMNQLGAAIK